ncbi:hypothetical protein [Shimia sp.]|uniref:hypothetical protein n=1 Tax=Shimia sp. TaxID=1954381 RepID=UPI003299B1A3
MTKLICAALIGVVTIPLFSTMAEASTMSRACLRSDRPAATRSMCRCIQQVANQNLSRTDQKMAATFFSEPHKAQVIRQSDRSSHEKFWLRYKEFGSVVAASCGHLR